MSYCIQTGDVASCSGMYSGKAGATCRNCRPFPLRVTISDVRDAMIRLFQNKTMYRSLTLAFLFFVTLTMSAQWASPQR